MIIKLSQLINPAAVQAIETLGADTSVPKKYHLAFSKVLSKK